MKKPQIIELDRRGARYLVDVALSGASKDDITPVICGALVEVTASSIRVTCTDRYRAHTALLTFKPGDKALPDFEFIFPRSALEWLSRNLNYFGSYKADAQRIIIEVTPHDLSDTPHRAGALAIRVVQNQEHGSPSVSWTGKHTLGNYPPVIRLISEARDAEPIAATPRLNLALLAPAVKLQRESGEHPDFKFIASTNPNKPGPLYMSWKSGGKVYAEAILQPHLVLR